MEVELEKDEFQILNYLDIYKTVNNLEKFEEGTGLESDMVEIILTELKDREYVEDDWEITSQGEGTAHSYRQQALEESGKKDEALELCDKFEEINSEFKDLVTEYQEEKADTLPGEESPSIPMNRLEDIHKETIEVLNQFSDIFSMFERYIERFNFALDKLKEGESEYLVKDKAS